MSLSPVGRVGTCRPDRWAHPGGAQPRTPVAQAWMSCLAATRPLRWGVGMDLHLGHARGCFSCRNVYFVATFMVICSLRRSLLRTCFVPALGSGA